MQVKVWLHLIFDLLLDSVGHFAWLKPCSVEIDWFLGALLEQRLVCEMLRVRHLRLLISQKWHDDFMPVFLVVVELVVDQIFDLIFVEFILIIVIVALIAVYTDEAFFDALFDEVWFVEVMLLTERHDIAHLHRLPVGKRTEYAHGRTHVSCIVRLVSFSDLADRFSVVAYRIAVLDARIPGHGGLPQKDCQDVLTLVPALVLDTCRDAPL